MSLGHTLASLAIKVHDASSCTRMAQSETTSKQLRNLIRRDLAENAGIGL
jgi:hypothetical protein